MIHCSISEMMTDAAGKLVKECYIKYGFYPLVLAIKFLESVERFEECTIIKEVLQTEGEKIGLTLPTQPNEQALQMVKDMCEASQLDYNNVSQSLKEHSDKLCCALAMYNLKASRS